jgi:hypothetical protein
MRAASNIGKCLVDRDPLDKRREFIKHRDGGIAQPLVILEVAIDKNQLRAKLARLPARHAAAYAENLGFVRSGKHNTAADRYRPPTQRRVKQLLDRGVEAVQVSMEDGGRDAIQTVHLRNLSRNQSGSSSSETMEHRKNMLAGQAQPGAGRGCRPSQWQ